MEEWMKMIDDESAEYQRKVATEKEKKQKKRRISLEEKRLRESYRDIPNDVMRVADGLIRRAAYMKVTLEDYEKDLDENGYVEMFSQSEKAKPYERERPVARLYNAMNKNYQSIIKQIADLLPDKPIMPATPPEDDFDNFVKDK